MTFCGSLSALGGVRVCAEQKEARPRKATNNLRIILLRSLKQWDGRRYFGSSQYSVISVQSGKAEDLAAAVFARHQGTYYLGNTNDCRGCRLEPLNAR